MANNKVFSEAVEYAASHTKKIHLLGLVSDGGVHAHINHLLGLCDLLKDHKEVEIYIHAFMDGRDTDPKSGIKFLQQVEQNISGTNIRIATVIGRYYAMDRDKRWERIKLAYDLLVNGKGTATSNFETALNHSYEAGITDEFLKPLYNATIPQEDRTISTDDVVMFFNFRTDRPRQLTEVLTQKDYHEYDMHKIPLYFVAFTRYD
ncbi:MAG: 2,3-bisphosphoglycerate-independent phosphoglycerate mutase, partial [Chitinophagales bacterium]|nr:2,3-bisphosphoglycerate-independent phosphoglycerate mutase [Chitinophagales bacterium]